MALFPLMQRLRCGSRAFWIRQLHQWHWLSSALCLGAMLIFAGTGITLNHAAQIEAQPHISTRHGQVPAALLAQLLTPASSTAALPPALRAWFGSAAGISVSAQAAEWSADEVYLALPRPGGDAWLRVTLPDGAWEYELTERGLIAYLNDLHKGRHAGPAWNWLIDLFAVLCLIFCITGFVMLKIYAGQRPLTWPLILLGLLLPLLALSLLH
ncbi:MULTISPECIES: PepSY-associated TM helix domain-containing protein [unclassified Undibacterium]|uniref:PepSY-associated TM helix domain-containing protein n=1 Tax=unclassified Undibacterium TaxID=2630295 RepID=UPI002AC924E7|nr:MULTISPECIES: PepSY-associated TM helix domain-containing protein [unclassified Undibacterium]MEB0140476.1 PepSY-associated TM helix domain-containing protein [Undibacterium sp. CCC2.1]MEB0173719.1 PepSY-associated TM helix domain-containing protein [Undibacterium sp. CCC1.1]MEB0177719.1 PepSY-associated TM helix domain-containing protein [Undibacterium sp. CCC3.4]MEB0217016.1 PepSY-associated TM helix domain-containing protein [Undibacterium sp. 5I2]WPX44607.1 PepSY-associated TM helix dom